MSTRTNLSVLKETLEQLFPGKWSTGTGGYRSLATGIAALDNGVIRGMARRRITEWVGPLSSGKTSLLRAIVAHWCASGMHVVYVDKSNRLRASDWAFVESGNSGVCPANMALREVAAQGRFLVARHFKGERQEQDALWAAEQLIRSGIFDVVIFDAAGRFSLSSRVYARLQRALDKSKTVLLILKDEDVEEKASLSWGCHARLGFSWTLPVECERGVSGIASILPAIHCSAFKDGLSQKIEVNIRSHVTNRLFTHPQVPDRRTSKA